MPSCPLAAMTMAARLVNVPPEPNSSVRHEDGVLRVLAQVAIDAGDQLARSLRPMAVSR